jgi:hypothetical protein
MPPLCALLLAALLACAPRGGTGAFGGALRGAAKPPGAATSAPNATPASHWAAWLSSEVVAQSYRRTAAELRHFEHRCAFLAPAWADAHSAYASLERVLVIDARIDWNGLGDSLERYVFALRAGRALRRATFLHTDGCADPDAPPRSPAQFRRNGGCAFDPGAYVTGLGGLSWRWDAAQAARVAAAQGATEPLTLLLQCVVMDFTRGCVHATLRFAANNSMAVEATGPESPRRVADTIWGYVRDELGSVPTLRLQTVNQGDLADVARLPWVCEAAGHPGSDGTRRGGCPLECEAFATWRPRPRTWAAMRPALLQLDAWDGAVGLLLRSGAADHVAAHPEALDAAVSAADEDEHTRQLDTALLAALFAPCAPNASLPAGRELPDGAVPCVSYGQAGPPDAAAAAACAADGAPPADDAPDVAALAALAPGPLGAYIACAATSAHALAGDAASAASAVSLRRRYGVMLFSDAPAFKCLLERSALAAAGHVSTTHSAPGHVAYAPDGAALHAVAQAAIVDHYLMGLLDALLPITRSAYGGSALVRRGGMPPRLPRGEGITAPVMAAGMERWFAVGRENLHGEGSGRVDDGRLAALLAAPAAAGCAVTAASVAHTADAYRKSRQEQR